MDSVAYVTVDVFADETDRAVAQEEVTAACMHAAEREERAVERDVAKCVRIPARRHRSVVVGAGSFEVHPDVGCPFAVVVAAIGSPGGRPG